jgi:hypothetical protein
MQKPERAKTIRAIKARHVAYLATIAGSKHEQAVRSRFRLLARRLQDLLRKNEGSANSLKGIPSPATLLFGLEEDLPRLRLPAFSFDQEKAALNRYVISALDQRRVSKYSDECGSYGEALLNCYLDLFITLTVPKTPRKIEAKPSFLVNPVTGSGLEIDVLLEDFRLAFEFQGEHHYVDPKVMAKDAFKLNALAGHKRILIPVNIVQLHGETLQTLIVNSIKDHLDLHRLLVSRDPSKLQPASASPTQLIQFSKAVQRIYLSKILFGPSFAWLDNEAKQYISQQSRRNPVSSTTPAPRHVPPAGDLDVTYIYRALKYVTKARRK